MIEDYKERYEQMAEVVAIYRHEIVPFLCSRLKERVEVVRCKDCKHFGTEDCSMFFDNDYYLLNWARDNDFCSWGKRKEE